MSAALREAQRHATELRTALTSAERDLSDLRLALGGGLSASEVAKRLGVQQPGLVDAADDLLQLQRLKPKLVARIEDFEVKIQVAQSHIRLCEQNAPADLAVEAQRLVEAEQAKDLLQDFVTAAGEADQHLAAFLASYQAMSTASGKLERLGYPVATNPEIVRIMFGKVLDHNFRPLDRSREFVAFRPGQPNSFSSFAAAWAVSCQRRIDDAFVVEPIEVEAKDEAA